MSDNMTTAPAPEGGTRQQKTVYLDWTNDDGNILITPSDESRFVIKVGAAIEILRRHSQEKQAEKQFHLLVGRLALWLDDHNAVWDRAFLTAGEATLRFVVVRKASRYDEEASDSLSDLELDLARDEDLTLIKVTTTALPNASDEALKSFLDPEFTLEYASRTRSHRAGE
jgi:hypothetical protein